MKKQNELPNFDKLWDYNHPDSTEIKFAQLIPQAKKSGNLDYYLQLFTQIARTEGLQGNFKKANETLSEVDSFLISEIKIAKIRYLLEQGRIYNSSGNPEKAKEYFLKAWKFGNENKLDLYAIDVAHMLGIVTPPEKQLEWSLKALELTEKTDEALKIQENLLREIEDKKRDLDGYVYEELGELYLLKNDELVKSPILSF